MRVFRPRSRGGLAFRFFLLAVLVTGSVAATAAVAGLLQVQNLVNDISFNKAIQSNAIKVPAAGAPQTILLIGSDHRVGEPFKLSNTDTMLLVHLDASSSTINVMSLPRDLEVDIPGYGTNKLNAAYSEGGWNLLIKTVQQNVFPDFVPNHIIDVNFSGFADLVNAIGCVYSDVDHRYYNQSEPAPSPDNYASINIQPGYQKLCGGNNGTNGALSFARFRHTDTDLTREARQQDFIRWAKSQYPISRLLSNRDRLLRIFGKHSQSDTQLHSIDGLLKVFDLVANMEGKGATIKQIPYPATLLPCGGTDPATGAVTPCYVGSKSPEAVKSTWARFIAATPVAGAKRNSTGAAPRHKHVRPLTTAGLTRRSQRRPGAGGGAQARQAPGLLPAPDRDGLVVLLGAHGQLQQRRGACDRVRPLLPARLLDHRPGRQPLPRLSDDAAAQPRQLRGRVLRRPGDDLEQPTDPVEPGGHQGRRRPQAVPLQGRLETHPGGMAPRRRRLLDLEQPHREPPQQSDAGDRGIVDPVQRMTPMLRRPPRDAR